MPDGLMSIIHDVSDLNKTITKTVLRDLFVTEDKNAHAFDIQITRAGEPVDLTGAAVTGYFMRYKDRISIPLTGSVQGTDTARIVLDDDCYAISTLFAVTVCVTLGDVKHAVFMGEGQMSANRTDYIIDPSGVIPSLEDILAQYDLMRTGTDAANVAASKANAAASHAPYVGVNGNWYVWDTTISKYKDTSVKATGAAGADGITPQITATVETGEPGTQVEITVSGTTENPVFHFKIPRGDTGAVDGIDYYAGDPAPLGTASPGTANGVSRGDHVHPYPIVMGDVMPESPWPVLWMNTDPFGENAAVATMLLDEDETGSEVQVEVDGEDYAVTNTSLNDDPDSSSEYGVTTE